MVVRSRFCERHELVAGVEHGEAAGAVGRLDHARREAGLADGGRLLVAGDAADRDRGAEDAPVGLAELCGRIHDLRQHRPRHAEHAQKVVVPGVPANVEHQRARGVRRVRHVPLAARQAPDEPAVDRAEDEVAGLGPRPRALDLVEHPGDLGAGEIAVDQQARLLGDGVGVALGDQPLAQPRRAPVLPDDGVVDRLAGVPVPDERRLALVGDAEPGEVGGGDLRLGDRLAHRVHGRSPQILRVVLDPAGAGEMLRELELPDPHHTAFAVEHDGAGRGRALVDGEDEAAHGCCLPGPGAVVASAAPAGRAGACRSEKRPGPRWAPAVKLPPREKRSD